MAKVYEEEREYLRQELTGANRTLQAQKLMMSTEKPLKKGGRELACAFARPRQAMCCVALSAPR